MGDLRTNWSNPGMPNHEGLGGEGITGSGSDPQIDTNAGGAGGLQKVWEGAFVPTPGGEETSNSVSGLPAMPNRWEPSETPPGPPDLTDRRPGNVDKR